MTKLKTLKDLERFPVETSITAYKRVKQEAIKWVKFKQNIYGKSIIEARYNSDEVNECIDNAFKLFFNISEEDLK